MPGRIENPGRTDTSPVSGHKTVLITGTGKGLGLALAEEFLRAGWTVFALARKKTDALRLQALDSQRCIALTADVTTVEVQAEIERKLNVTDGIDVLINNAGIGGSGPALDNASADEAAALLNVHCLGALRVIRAVLPYLKKGGLVINISSRFGSLQNTAAGKLDHVDCSYAYRIAKAAQNMLTLCLSREFKSAGIRVCALHPGRLKTTCASSDADAEPTAAAARLLDRLDSFQNGKFYSLFGGELAW